MDTHATSVQTHLYRVSGMSCGHCAAAVEGQVAEVDGVSEVDVDLASGGMTVRGSGISDDAVAAAVAEAGYEAVVA
jgi:copper chaperone CopZ